MSLIPFEMSFEDVMLNAKDGQAWAQCEVGVRMGAQGGDAEAMYSLGFVYERGHGVPQDQMESRRWYQLAANLGHEKARSKI